MPIDIDIEYHDTGTSALYAVPISRRPRVRFQALPFDFVRHIRGTFTAIVLFRVRNSGTGTLLHTNCFFRRHLPRINKDMGRVSVVG